MKHKSWIKNGLFAVGLIAAMGTVSLQAAYAADCSTADTITIAEMTWLSAGAEAHIAARIIGDGYGCKVEIVPGDTIATATSMLTRAQPDIAPELWISTVQSTWDQIVEKGLVYKANDIFADGGQEGWWIPDYLAEANPHIKSFDDLKANWQIFEDESAPGKGRFYACPPGWGCETINANLFRALKLDETFDMYPTGSDANLKASLARQVARKKPFIGWYFGPSEVIGKYNLKRLDMPAHDPQKFVCLTDINCPDPQLTGWAEGEVAVAVSLSLRDKAPEIAEFLSKFQFPNDELSRILAWADDNKAATDEIAVYFLKNYPQIWKNWVSEDIAQKVEAKL